MSVTRTSRAVVAVVMTAATLSSSPATATAVSAEQTLQQQIDEQLTTYPGGRQVSINEVAYQDGAVVVAFADPRTGRVPEPPVQGGAGSATLTDHGCPWGKHVFWYCFYEHINYGGRRLQFRDCSTAGLTQYFAPYGFENKTSSYVNTASLKIIDVYSRTDGYGWLWSEYGVAHQRNVGTADNDKAKSFVATCAPQ